MQLSPYNEVSPSRQTPEFWTDGAGNLNRSATAPRFYGSGEHRAGAALEHILVELAAMRDLQQRQTLALERIADALTARA